MLFNYRAGSAEPGFGEDDAAMVLAPHVLKEYLMRNRRKDMDIRVMVCDQREHQEVTLRKIRLLEPDVVGFSCFVWNFSNTLSLSRKLRLVLPRTEIVLGGPEVSDRKHSAEIMALHPWVDAVIRGEGEIPLEMFLDRRTPRRSIQGLTFREEGRIIANDGLPRFPNPEAIPSVYTPEFVRGLPVVYYATSRGCVGRCRYCQEWSRKRNLSIERIEQDLAVIFKYGNMKLFGFIDSVLDDDPKRLYEILDITARLNKRGVPISAYFYFRRAEPELFDLLERAHFKYLRVGIESQNPDTLLRVGRGEKNLSYIENAMPYKHKFNIVPYIISHLPGETPASFRSNIQSCFRKGLLQLDFHCNRLDIFPGTYLYRHAAEEGYTFDNRPPHHVFFAKNWPYKRFIEDKSFLRNVMVLGRIFMPEDEPFLAYNGFDLFRIASTIHKVVPGWKSAYRPLSSDTISDVIINDNIPDLFAAYVEKECRKKTARDVLLRLFAFRHCCFLARRVPDRFGQYRAFSEAIELDSRFFIPYYACLPPGPDVTFAEAHPRTRFADLPRSRHGIFVLGRFPHSAAYTMTGRNERDVESFLAVLRENQAGKRKLSELLRELRPSQREAFVSLARRLLSQNSLLAEQTAPPESAATKDIRTAL